MDVPLANVVKVMICDAKSYMGYMVGCAQPLLLIYINTVNLLVVIKQENLRPRKHRSMVE